MTAITVTTWTKVQFYYSFTLVDRMLRFLPFLLLFLLAGCQSGAPSFVIAGSYFPAWLVFSWIAIALTALIRVILIRLGIDDMLRFKLVVYICIAISLCLIGLTVFFSP